MRKATRLSLGLLLLVTACASTPAGPRFTEGLPNFVKVNGHLYRGGQPTVPAGVQALAASGIVTVIDLRQPYGRDPSRAAEQAAVEAAGMQYVSEPLPGWAAPDRQAVERLLAVIEDPTRQPVFIHCRRGADRTGTIVAIYRLRHDCWSAEQAIGEARAHDMAIWEIGMRHFVREWYGESRRQRVRTSALKRGAVLVGHALAADSPVLRDRSQALTRGLVVAALSLFAVKAGASYLHDYRDSRGMAKELAAIRLLPSIASFRSTRTATGWRSNAKGASNR